MAGNEEGGVHTKKVILTMASLFTVMMLVIIPVSQTSSGAQFGIEGGKTLMGVGDTLSADDDNAIRLFTDGTVYSATMKVVNSDGVTQSGAVSPTSYTFNTNDSVGLTITAPRTPGDYRLVVEFQLTSGSNAEKVTRTFPIKVVEPILLSIDIKNDSNSEIRGLSLQFVINGTAMDPTTDTENISISQNGSRTVTYKWVVDNPPGGRNTYRVQVYDTSTPLANITGLNQDHYFYIGQSDNTLVTWIMAIIFIVLLLILIWVVRKPVKNFGKPKGRR